MIILDVLATYRLTRLVTRDKITEDIRNKIGEELPFNSKITYFINCEWCVSVWAAIVIFSIRKKNPELADLVSGILAASAVTGLASDKGL